VHKSSPALSAALSQRRIVQVIAELQAMQKGADYSEPIGSFL